jgi:hypothetical protein
MFDNKVAFVSQHQAWLEQSTASWHVSQLMGWLIVDWHVGYPKYTF